MCRLSDSKTIVDFLVKLQMYQALQELMMFSRSFMTLPSLRLLLQPASTLTSTDFSHQRTMYLRILTSGQNKGVMQAQENSEYASQTNIHSSDQQRYIIPQSASINSIFITNAMTGTDRSLHSTSDPSFEGKFIRKVILGCFVDYVFVLIKNRTLYIYNSRQHYQSQPREPVCFFNLAHTEFVLEENSLRISNRCDRITLRHDNPERLLDLLAQIESHRKATGPMQVYPKKFVYLNHSADVRSASQQ